MLGGEPEIGSTEALGVLVAAIVLIITFGSLVAAGMTMLNALIGVGVGMAGLFALSGVVELTSTAPILALMLGLAVGIDYSLFITSRHRQNLLEGLSPEEAVGRAVGTAGSAVVFAGATVVIALAGLAVVGHPVPHRDGSRRRRHGHRRRARRDHPPAGAARLRRPPGAPAPAARRRHAPTGGRRAAGDRRPPRTAPASGSAGRGSSPGSASRSSWSACSASALLALPDAGHAAGPAGRQHRGRRLARPGWRTT